MQQIPRAIAVFKELYKRGSDSFIYNFRGFENKMQKEALAVLRDSKTKNIVFGGAAGGGKSFLGAYWIVMQAITHPNTQYFVGRETLQSIKKSTIPTFSKVFKILAISSEISYNAADNIYSFSNGSKIYLLNLQYLPSDPMFERFGSTEFTQGWIEEGGEIDEGAFEILKTRIGRFRNEECGLMPKLLITCNPKKNWLYTNFYLPWKNGTLSENCAFLQALCAENPFISKSYIENLQEIKDEAQRDRLLFGDWEYDNSPRRLISSEAVDGIFNKDFIPNIRYITADVARYGSDRSVIIVWDGWQMIKILALDKQSVVSVASQIRSLMSEFGVDAKRVLVDQDGVGGGVVDILRCIGFQNGGRPTKDGSHYFNLATECGYLLAQAANDGKLGATEDSGWLRYCGAIRQELEQLQTAGDVDSESKLRLKSKDLIKRDIGRSPDFLDAIKMRVYFDLYPFNASSFVPLQNRRYGTR